MNFLSTSLIFLGCYCTVGSDLCDTCRLDAWRDSEKHWNEWNDGSRCVCSFIDLIEDFGICKYNHYSMLCLSSLDPFKFYYSIQVIQSHLRTAPVQVEI